MKNFEFYRFSGVQAKDVELRIANVSGKEIALKLEALKVRLNILPLILLEKSLSTYVEIAGGEIEAIVNMSGKNIDVELEAEEISLKKLPLLQEYTGMPLNGKLSTQVEMQWRQTLSKSIGEIQFTLTKGALGPGSVQGFSVPALNLGDIELNMTISKGQFDLKSFKQSGGELSARLHLSSELRPKLLMSSLDACGEFKLNQDFLDKNPNLKTALQLAEVQLKKDSNQYIHAAFRGTFSRPRLRRQVLCSDSNKSKKKK